MNILSDNISEIVDLLHRGKTILYPTDTIWGIGCDATNTEAIERIYEIKKRDRTKPLIILVSDIEMLKKYVPHLHPRIETLLVYHKRPLTLLHKNTTGLPEILLKKKKAAIRIVKEPFIASVIKQLGKPITSTSANIAGQEFPKSFNEISPEIIRAVDYVFRYRQNDTAQYTPSVIATYNNRGILKFLR